MKLWTACILGLAAPHLAPGAGQAIQANEAASNPFAVSAPTRLTDRPDVTIGRVEGRLAEQFERIVAGSRLSDGSLVVADAGAGEIRIFSANGEFLRRMGGAGEGPGEFTGLAAAFLRADSVYTWDSRQSRITVFDPSGRMTRTVRISMGSDGRRPRLIGVLSSGSFVVRSSRPVVAGRTPDGILRDSVRFDVFTPDGQHARLITVRSSEEAYALTRGRHTSVSDLPFRYAVVGAARADVVIIARGDEYRLDRYASTGERSVLMSAPADRGRVDAETIERAMERELARLREIGFYQQMEANVRAKYDAAPRGRPLPVISDLLIGSDARVWVLVRPMAEGGPVWAVHRQDGGLDGVFQLPPTARLLDAGPEWVLATFVDELGVPYVGLWNVP